MLFRPIKVAPESDGGNVFFVLFLYICRCFQLKCKIGSNKEGLKFLKVLKIFRHYLFFSRKLSKHQKT